MLKVRPFRRAGPTLAVVLAAALVLAASSILGAASVSAQVATGSTACSVDVGISVDSSCAIIVLPACVRGVVLPDRACFPTIEEVTTSTVGTSACPGGVSVVEPSAPCPAKASQTCFAGLVLSVAQTCPEQTDNCPNGQVVPLQTPCPGVSPDSCPHGGFGPMPRDCTGIGGG